MRGRGIFFFKILFFAAAVAAAATQVEHVLEDIQATGDLVRIAVTELITDPITSEPELEVALKRIGDAAQDQLADGKQVKLQ